MKESNQKSTSTERCLLLARKVVWLVVWRDPVERGTTWASAHGWPWGEKTSGTKRVVAYFDVVRWRSWANYYAGQSHCGWFSRTQGAQTRLIRQQQQLNIHQVTYNTPASLYSQHRQTSSLFPLVVVVVCVLWYRKRNNTKNSNNNPTVTQTKDGNLFASLISTSLKLSNHSLFPAPLWLIELPWFSASRRRRGEEEVEKKKSFPTWPRWE